MELDSGTAQGVADGMIADAPYCSDHEQSQDHKGCDMQSCLGCTFQCGAMSPVFVPAAVSTLWHPCRKGDGGFPEFVGLELEIDSQLFRPPISSILV
ncbi:MAG: hypothetical protein IID54_02295 [Proteobacteria bacterium]|nr:hypothetical protein [Pseudomonadota bacterium]